MNGYTICVQNSRTYNSSSHELGGIEVAGSLLPYYKWCLYRCKGGYLGASWSYWVHSGIVTGGQYNSSEGCKPYSIAKCDHHVTGESRDSPHLLILHLVTLPSQGQYPSCSSTLENTPACSMSCRSGHGVEYARDKHFGSTFYWISGHQNIMKELYYNGPVEASFLVYEDFLYYKSGMHLHTNRQCRPY